MLIRISVVLLTMLSALTLLVLSTIREPQDASLHAHQGILDLSTWNPELQERIRLDGQWEFYWHKLLPTPAQLIDQKHQVMPASPDAYAEVPGTWGALQIGDKRLPSFGFATYRLVLRNTPVEGILAIKKSNIRFASEIYVNGTKLMEDGHAVEKAAGYKAGNSPDIEFFPYHGGDIEILVRVANYDYSNAGISGPLFLGEQAAMLKSHQNRTAIELATMAVLATIAVIFLISYLGSALYRNRDDSLLLLGLICLLYALYNGMISERVLAGAGTELPFSTLYKLKDFCSVACLGLLIFYFYRFRTGMISRTLTFITLFIFGAYIALLALFPISVYVLTAPFVIGLYTLILLWLLLQCALRFVTSEQGERLSSFLWYSAFLCITLYCLDINLFSISLKENVSIGQVCIVLFSMLMLSLAVLRFFEAYLTVRSLKDQLLLLDRVKDDFLSNTSHELKTPLNAIVNISESLLKGSEGPLTDDQAHNLAIVTGSGRRLTYLVDELLDYSKMKHGDIPLYRSSTDLSSYVESVMRIHSFLLGTKKVELVNDIPAHFPAIYADGNRLVQILHNLIGNAVKFTERGSIRVSAAVVHRQAELRIADTGRGISPDMLEHIFLPFEQEVDTRSMTAGGTGLGLSITRKLVEMHGGTIYAESTPGQGATFILTFPLADSKKEKRSNVTPIRIAPAVSGNRALRYEEPVIVQGIRNEWIVVVDDDEANLQTIISLLKLEGYSYAVTSRSRSVLELLDKLPAVHLVIADIMMPGMSGYELLDRIRERFSPSELPVLMLTAGNKAHQLKLALEKGANDFVPKPFESEELLARIGGLTRMKTSIQAARDAEISFLRSQINPHFLYNALNAIAELCVDTPNEAERLILQLSSYLRGSVHFKHLDSKTSLENELSLIEAYVAIEQARFGSRLEVIIDVDADVDRNMHIPPLTLQPLIENAIRHGLMARVGGGRVMLSIRNLSETETRFTIEDNGIGMTKEKMKDILQVADGSTGVGLWNISSRLKLLYNRDFQIQSHDGEGTRITFDLPIQHQGNKGNGGYSS
ncbi:MAG: response regulator [Paenibacillus sp.]|uniref:ATP-binding protein n=1 Tax=Paenibacillus sp. TaxID=58172 RepID=UPI0025E3A67D|nr:ATP-binding protein [Paenibacillus sp.]MBR2566025.1 response regulator [Paenibacillus sp.]